MNFGNDSPNERTRLINILATMYNDNYTQIRQLTDSNERIRNTINRLLITSNPTRNRRNYYSTFYGGRNTNTPNYLYSQNYNTNSNSNYTNQNNFNDNYLSQQTQHQPQPQHQTQTQTQTQNVSVNEIIRNFLSPIEIFPTTAQIENATRIVRYSDIVRPNNISCPISLEPFHDDNYVSVIRFCNHIFNTNELNMWFQRNCRCPVCRYDIRNYNQNMSPLNSPLNTNTEVQDQEQQPRQEREQEHQTQPTQDPIVDVLTNYATNFLTDFIHSPTRLDVSGNMYTYTYVIDMSGNRIY
jgi:hypothetical protein